MISITASGPTPVLKPTPILMLMLVLTCAAGLAPAAHGAELGRLFLSAPERAELERVRQGGRPASVAGDEAPVGEAAAPAQEGDNFIVLDGVVTRSGGGRPTVWLDGVAHTGRAPAVTLRQDGGASLRIPSGRQVRLKPGQSVDTFSGRVREGHEVGTLSIAPGPSSR